MGEIQDLLENFGCEGIMTVSGMSKNNSAWVIRFQYNQRTYRFTFKPLTCRISNKLSSFGGKKREHGEQAKYQMGRRAYYFVKAILTAALDDSAALFGFLELPGATSGEIPMTAAELDVTGLVGLLPELTTHLHLGDGK